MNQYLLSVMKGQRTSFTAQLITYLLLPWTFVYWIGLFCHWTYHRLKGAYKSSKPVISVGNITVGGSGKTPLVIWLARSLQDKGFKSIILTRGYMTKKSKDSDEVDMLNEQIPYIPVIPGADRARNIKMAEEIMPVDVYICDDAFQHWPLRCDLNIVAIDAGNPFGNGFLLPAGVLREPLTSLRRADVFILTKTNNSMNTQGLSAKLKKINPKALIMESRFKSHGSVDVIDESFNPEDFLVQKPVVGFCAIGDPLSFESSLKNSGAVLVKLFAFMDHHSYKKDDIGRLLDFCRKHHVQVLVTTHKDAVKLRAFKGMFTDVRLIYIPIQLEIVKGSDEFFQKVISLCLN